MARCGVSYRARACCARKGRRRGGAGRSVAERGGVGSVDRAGVGRGWPHRVCSFMSGVRIGPAHPAAESDPQSHVAFNELPAEADLQPYTFVGVGSGGCERVSVCARVGGCICQISTRLFVWCWCSILSTAVVVVFNGRVRDGGRRPVLPWCIYLSIYLASKRYCAASGTLCDL